MATQYQPVRRTVAHIIDQSIKPLAHSEGFKKSGLNFHRRNGELVHSVNVQLSRYNFGPVGGFFINIGIAFDKLYGLKGLPVDEKPAAYRCHFCRRIDYFCPTAPDEWFISESTDTEEMTARLTDNFKTVLGVLDGIDSIPNFLARNLLQPGSAYGLLAQLQYVMGDLDAARQAVQLEAEFFVDRHGMSVSELIIRHHLTRLATDRS